MTPSIGIDGEKLEAFCRKWKITEFALFGSVLREDFGPKSDVDVLVTFGADESWSLLDLIGAEQELSELFERKVDLIERRAIEKSENWIRRKAILSGLEIIVPEEGTS